MKLEGKRAVVTGGGSGIGRAIANRFTDEGATVAVNDINADTAEKTVAELGRGIAIPADGRTSAVGLSVTGRFTQTSRFVPALKSLRGRRRNASRARARREWAGGPSCRRRPR